MVEDVTHLLDKELGTAFDTDTMMFSAFDGGAVFNYDTSTIRDYDKMLERDGKAAAIEKVLTLPIRQAPWSIQQGDASKRVTDFIDKVFRAPANNGGMTTPMNLIIAQSLQAIVYRKSFFEKVLTERDGRVVYDKIAWRPPATCTLRRDMKTGAFNGFNQMPIRYEDTKEIHFSPQRSFVYIHGTHRNPMEGISELDIAYWGYITKQKIRFLWYSFLEGQSLPKTVVRAPDRTSARNAAKELVTLRQSGVVGLEKSIDVDPLESSGRGAGQFKEAIQWLDSEVSGSVLAGFTDLGASASGGTGSFALSKDQTDFFLMSRQTDSRELQDHFNQYLIPDLVRYNFGPGQPSPMFQFGPIAQDDANQAINLLQSAAGSWTDKSILPREFFEELIERVAGFLDLDVKSVREGLERAKAKAEKQVEQAGGSPSEVQVAGVAAGVGAATDAVQNGRIGQQTQNPTPSRNTQANRPPDPRVNHR